MLSSFKRILCVVPLLAAVVTAQVELDADTFNKVVDYQKDVFVQFYAPWCSHCHDMKPDYEDLAVEFKGKPDLVIARIDADANQQLALEHKIEGFPTLRFYKKGSYTFEEYIGERDQVSMARYITEQTGIKPSGESIKFRKEEIKKLPLLDELDDAALMDAINTEAKKTALLMFRKEDGSLKKYRVMQKVKRAYARDNDIIVAAVDIKKAPQFRKRYKIKKVPLVLLLKYGEIDPDLAVRFDDPEFTALRMVEFVNDHAGMFRQLDGNLQANAGLVLEFEEFTKRFFMMGTDKEKQQVINDAVNLAESVPLRHIHYYKEIFQNCMKDSGYLQREETALEEYLQRHTEGTSEHDWATVRLNIIRSVREVDEQVKNGTVFTEEDMGLVEHEEEDLGLGWDEVFEGDMEVDGIGGPGVEESIHEGL